MSRKRWLTLILTSIVFVVFILPMIGVSILQVAVLPPEKLTPLVVEKTNQFIEANMECERVELTYFETYPYLGVRLTNGRLISRSHKDSLNVAPSLDVPADSLLSFKSAVVVFNPTEYLFRGVISVPRIILEGIRFYGFVDDDGRTNWDIYNSDQDGDDDSSSSELPKIDLRQVKVTDGRFVYDDRQQDVYAAIDGFFLRIDGLLTGHGNRLDVETGSSSIRFRSPSYSLSNQMAMRFKGSLSMADGYRHIGLRNAELMVNNLPFTADGFYESAADGGNSKVDMTFGLKLSDMNDLIQLVPNEYLKDRDKMLAKGRVILDGSFRGEYGENVVPTLNLCCKIEDGSYHLKGMEHGIDTLRMDIDFSLNGAHPDSSFVSLEELTLVGLNTSLSMSGEVKDIFRNPDVRADVNGNVDFTRLASDFLNPDTLLLEGVMQADISTEFRLDDLMNSRFGRVKSAGNLSIDRFKAYSKPLDVDMYIAGAKMFVGSTDSVSRYLDTKGLLNANLSVDSINIMYGDLVSTNVGGLRMEANTTPVIDTSAVIPLTARLEFDNLRTKLPDSTWMVAGKTLLRGGIKASHQDKRMPVAAATISVDTMKYILLPLHTGLVMSEGRFDIEAFPYRRHGKRRAGRAAIGVSDSLSSSADSIAAVDWEARGKIGFKGFRAASHLLPLPIYMDETVMMFDTNHMTLSGACLHLGNSDLSLSGKLWGIRSAMRRGGRLRGDFELVSDLIDCNQLMLAMNQGAKFIEQNPITSVESISEDSLSVFEVTPILEDSATIAAADSSSGVFVLPRFLDMKLHTNAKRINFKDLELESVMGDVILRDQNINLSGLRMKSNIGSGNLTMVYTAKEKREAIMGFELSLNDILVDRLIGLFPDIDTLVPMLRSFEGMVDCQMTATCKTDSLMSVLLPSVNASCYLSGKNMVLLDGETFTEISKTLMFKNKKRNMIDSIAVDLAIRDNQIEVYPFLVEMDRYKVAVGGTHNLDMTFDYHLSVLKSPVPFKLGIDIKGNLDDFKFKIVKCRYKDFLKPAKQAELDSVRRDVREDIRNAIREQIREAAPELGNSLSMESDILYESVYGSA